MPYKQRVKDETLTPAEQYEKAMAVLESTDPEVTSSVEYEIASYLRDFETAVHANVKSKNIKKIRDLKYDKTKELISLIEKMVELHAGFNFEGIVPFEKICTDCKGAGVKFKFFRKLVKVECKFCDKDPETNKANGYRTIPCKPCRGSGQYEKVNGRKITCTKCEGKGEVTFKCNKCRNEKERGTFTLHPIDSKVKSTTHCKTCEGLGFIPDKPIPVYKPKEKKLEMESRSRKVPLEVLTQNLGELLSAAQVKKDS